MLLKLTGMFLLCTGIGLLTQTDATFGPLMLALAGLLACGSSPTGTTVEE